MVKWRNLKRYPKCPCHTICVPPSVKLPLGGFHLDQGYSFLKGGGTCIGTDFTARPCWVMPRIPVTSQEARGGGEMTRTLRRDWNTPPFKALPAFCHTFKRLPSSSLRQVLQRGCMEPPGDSEALEGDQCRPGQTCTGSCRCSVTILPDSS